MCGQCPRTRRTRPCAFEGPYLQVAAVDALSLVWIAHITLEIIIPDWAWSLTAYALFTLYKGFVHSSRLWFQSKIRNNLDVVGLKKHTIWFGLGSS